MPTAIPQFPAAAALTGAETLLGLQANSEVQIPVSGLLRQGQKSAAADDAAATDDTRWTTPARVLGVLTAHGVRFDAAQALTAPQQAQARANIGAAPVASPVFSGTLTSAGSIALDNGNADGIELVFKSAGNADWNMDNFLGTLRFFRAGVVWATISPGGTYSHTGALNVVGFTSLSGGLYSGGDFECDGDGYFNADLNVGGDINAGGAVYTNAALTSYPTQLLSQSQVIQVTKCPITLTAAADNNGTPTAVTVIRKDRSRGYYIGGAAIVNATTSKTVLTLTGTVSDWHGGSNVPYSADGGLQGRLTITRKSPSEGSFRMDEYILSGRVLEGALITLARSVYGGNGALAPALIIAVTGSVTGQTMTITCPQAADNRYWANCISVTYEVL